MSLGSQEVPGQAALSGHPFLRPPEGKSRGSWSHQADAPSSSRTFCSGSPCREAEPCPCASENHQCFPEVRRPAGFTPDLTAPLWVQTEGAPGLMNKPLFESALSGHTSALPSFLRQAVHSQGQGCGGTLRVATDCRQKQNNLHHRRKD